MQPLDLLTNNDKETIAKWCTSYGGAEPQNVEQILAEWNKSKKRLLKALGGNLRVEIPIHTEMEKYYYYKKLEQVYKPFAARSVEDLDWWLKKENRSRTHRFIESLGQEVYTANLRNDDISYLSSYLSYTTVREGKILSAEHEFRGGRKESLKIPQGTKTMRAIRKVIEYYEFENSIKLFDSWRDDISLANTDKVIDATLVFSIHPIDFMTMSDNNSGWTSCMAWQHTGAYSAGTIEMMNSNLAVVAYLKNEEKPFFFDGVELPNKFWRSLVFVHKDLLLIGKNYPYSSRKMEEIILDKMQELLYNNLKWKYQYKKQKYYDLIKYSKSNSYIRDYLGRGYRKHKIYVYMKYAMYNDFIEDVDTSYLCCRNYVKKALYLNLCGKLTCLCCGKEIYDNNEYDYIYDEVETSKKYCDDCDKQYRCQKCGNLSLSNKSNLYNVRVYQNYVSNMRACKDCLKNEFLYDSARNLFVHKAFKDTVKEYCSKPVFIISDKDKLDDIAHNIFDCFSYQGLCKKIDFEKIDSIGVKYENCIIFDSNGNDFDFIKKYSGRSYYYSFNYVFEEDAHKLISAKTLYLVPVSNEWFENRSNIN